MLASAFRLPHVKFVFPTAPTRRVSINGGAAMPGEPRWREQPPHAPPAGRTQQVSHCCVSLVRLACPPSPAHP